MNNSTVFLLLPHLLYIYFYYKTMKIINIKNVPKQHLGLSLFIGRVIRQSPVTDNEGSDLSIDYVHFHKGARNKFHKHSNDQVLIVIKGEGIVAAHDEEFEVKKRRYYLDSGR